MFHATKARGLEDKTLSKHTSETLPPDTFLSSSVQTESYFTRFKVEVLE